MTSARIVDMAAADYGNGGRSLDPGTPRASIGAHRVCAVHGPSRGALQQPPSRGPTAGSRPTMACEKLEALAPGRQNGSRTKSNAHWSVTWSIPTRILSARFSNACKSPGSLLRRYLAVDFSAASRSLQLSPAASLTVPAHAVHGRFMGCDLFRPIRLECFRFQLAGTKPTAITRTGRRTHPRTTRFTAHVASRPDPRQKLASS